MLINCDEKSGLHNHWEKQTIENNPENWSWEKYIYDFKIHSIKNFWMDFYAIYGMIVRSGDYNIPTWIDDKMC